MNSLSTYISNYLAVVEKAINDDMPELPTFEEAREKYGNNTYIGMKQYTLQDLKGVLMDDDEEIEISFYIDTQYSEGFYAFVGVNTESVAELNDGSDPTFGNMGGFRIYLHGEE